MTLPPRPLNPEGFSDSDEPRYLHLLTRKELQDLHPVLEILRNSRDSVLASWYRKYLEHFGAARTLIEADFLELYGRDLDAVINNLLADDLAGFEADVRSTAIEMESRGVPFVEVVASLHLFEESSTEHFRTSLRVMVKGPKIHLTFDKLSHCRMILLASTYFEGHQARFASRMMGLEKEAERLSGGPGGRTSFHGLIGASPPMRRMYEQIAAAAGGYGAVLVFGPSGTGKELVARALHECHGPSGRPFIVVNCAALPAELIESELFGHAKGAYTGAQRDSQGLIRAADGGSLFLDEITEMATPTQAKLLRVLEDRKVRPVGSQEELPVDVRFIASTNRDPAKAVEMGFLREDLYYRIGVHRIAVPPLKDRLEDVPLLLDHFVDVLSRLGLPPVSGIDDGVIACLKGYSWPGNVRELKGAVEQALTLSRGGRLRRRDLPAHVVRASGAQAAPAPAAEDVPSFADAEKELIAGALKACGNNKSQAARMLKISRHRLYDKIHKYDL